MNNTVKNPVKTSYCIKCKIKTKRLGGRWCAGCWYPGIEEDYERFRNMLADGHRYIDAAVTSGWKGIEEFQDK